MRAQFDAAGLRGTKTRQAAAGRRIAAERGEATFQRLVRAYRMALHRAKGIPPRQKDVARCGVALRTVQRHWSRLITVVDQSQHTELLATRSLKERKGGRRPQDQNKASPDRGARCQTVETAKSRQLAIRSWLTHQYASIPVRMRSNEWFTVPFDPAVGESISRADDYWLRGGRRRFRPERTEWISIHVSVGPPTRDQIIAARRRIITELVGPSLPRRRWARPGENPLLDRLVAIFLSDSSLPPSDVAPSSVPEGLGPPS
jgi:hypothetical protein